MKNPTESESIQSIVAAVAGVKPNLSIEPDDDVRPDFQVDLIRPDDLLTLHVDGYNLKPVAGTAGPSLNRIDAAKDAFLIFTFPPQNIAETALFDSVEAEPPSLLPPGKVKARLAGFSRLVFRLPARARTAVIPYTIEGLLDWSDFELVVPALADVPAHPSPEQIANAPDIAPPDSMETAIELPYRLILSPDHRAAWLHAILPVTHASRTELWHTQLARKTSGGALVPLSPTETAPLRAIWSPDYSPARAFDTSQEPQKTTADPDLGVTDISPNDRHQIVILTSAFHGYGDANNAPFVPSPVDAQMLMLSPLGGWLRSRGHWDPPRALQFIPLSLDFFVSKETLLDAPTPLAVNLPPQALAPGAAAVGVTTRVVTEKPAAARASIPPLVVEAPITGEQLDLSEWVHVAAQGRDHYVRIVYEGHLYPFGHRAALIKITERKFKDFTLPDGGTTPVAYMFQREYIVVREPQKIYTGQLSGNVGLVAGRALPFSKIRLTTLVTPDLHLPRDIIGKFSSWVVVGSPKHDFPFHAVATDIAGNEVEFTASLIFASLTDVDVTPIQAEYVKPENSSRRACLVPNRKVTYAPRNPADTSTDNTTLVTSALYFDTDLRPQLTASFGGFFPKLYKADVNLPAIEQLVGTDAKPTIRLYQPYVDGGLDSNAGVFAEIVTDSGTALTADQLPIGISADKAGGIATPNLNISNLSRAHGPLAGDAGKAAQDTFDAGDFFGGLGGDLIPKLFGSLPLTKLLPTNGSTAKNAPKTQFSTVNAGGVKTLVVSFDWAPEVKDPVDIPGVSFTPNDNPEKNTPSPQTKLTIHGEIRKPIGPAGGSPTSGNGGTSSFNGELTHFRLDILDAIALHFETFTFSAGTGKKLDVHVGLNSKTPFEFEGDLSFVDKLSHIIPPGAFGDGPSIDLTPEPGVHVGYGVTLPPASVGVFSLENISLSAGLDLPFLTGKPLVDVAFAERHHPFLITVSLLGGGGFLHVQLDSEGMKMLEAAFEFGANVSINLGVASGGVHIMAGIYFSMQTDSGHTKATLTGYLRMGGELSILGIISLSLEFMLSFTLDSDGKASGRATLTVEVKVLFFSKSVEISVEKRFGGSGGDPGFAQLITSSSVWSDYAAAFA